MKTKTFKLTVIGLLQVAVIIFVALFSIFSFTPATTSASDVPVLVLTVMNMEGEPIVAVANDQTVVLEWYIDGPVTNCRIIQDNSVTGETILQTPDTTSPPTFDSMEVTPPPDSTTTFALRCEEVVEEVELNTNLPVVNLTSDQGTNLVNNPLTGQVDYLVIRWNSTDANRCSYIWREGVSETIITETSSSDYSNRLGASGWIRYDGSPRYINETTTFYITCYNDDIGAEVTKSLTVNVENPPPPDDPWLNMWGTPDSRNVFRSELYGYAWVPEVGYSSGNVTWCTQRARYEDGTPYSNPPNWGTHNSLSRTYTNIRLATTTIFEVQCGRGEVTIGETTYPATSTTKQLKMNVLFDGDIVSDPSDRTTLPPVTATLTVTPNPATRDALTGNATVVAEINRQNASRCWLRAHWFNEGTGEYTSTTTLSNWTNRSPLYGNGTSTYTITTLNQNTRFSAECVRDYDLEFGTAEEIENGRAYVQEIVLLEEPMVPAPDPVVSLYGNAVNMTADNMWSTKSAYSGFTGVVAGANPRFIQNSSPGTTSNSITFPFEHPHGASDTYDIRMRLCDQNNGESTFRIFVEGNFVGEYTTNDPSSPSASCDNDTILRPRLAQAIEINDGDSITVECDTPADGERCRFHSVYFGARGIVSTPNVNENNPSVPVPVLWLSENTTSCELQATRADSSTYVVQSNAPTIDLLNVNLSEPVTLSVQCSRGADSLIAEDTVRIYVPVVSLFSTETTLASGQCIDDGTFGSFGETIDAPPGYGPDDRGYCSPLIDLAAGANSLSGGGVGVVVNNVDGTYQNLLTRMVIENLGPGELPADSAISYRATMQLMPEQGSDEYETNVGSFNGVLSAPADPMSPTQSPVLTRGFTDAIPFGSHTLCARVNLDGSPNFPEGNPDPSNNSRCDTVTLPVPEPPMSISLERPFIRPEQQATVTWETNVSYELNCTAIGIGGLNETYNTSVVGQNHTDSFTTPPLENTGEFQLLCIEPITGTTFTETARVEVVPDYEER